MLYFCKLEYPEMYMPLLLSLTLGTRISETIGIHYYDVDFKSYTVYIERQLGRSTNEDIEKEIVSQELKTKTKNAVRAIPVPKWVVDEIILKRSWYETQKRIIPSFSDNDFICCKFDGSPFHRSYFTKDFHCLLSLHGLPDIHWHDLRHIYASTLRGCDVNMKAISEFLGHYSPDFTKEIYVHEERSVYDCSMLESIWDELKPMNDTEDVLQISFDESLLRDLFEGINTEIKY